eukprot:SAG31_NODE_17241_length_678_cov_0.930915_1_plen_46_part_01
MASGAARDSLGAGLVDMRNPLGSDFPSRVPDGKLTTVRRRRRWKRR